MFDQNNKGITGVSVFNEGKFEEDISTRSSTRVSISLTRRLKTVAAKYSETKNKRQSQEVEEPCETAFSWDNYCYTDTPTDLGQRWGSNATARPPSFPRSQTASVRSSFLFSFFLRFRGVSLKTLAISLPRNGERG